jgi:PAS domain-containing protein
MQVAERLYRAILEAIPLPVFLVDGDMRVYEVNRAARKVFGSTPDTTLTQRGGELLHCLNAHDPTQGCGLNQKCKDCVVRNSILACLSGQVVHRRRMKLQMARGTEKKELELLVTAAPLPTEEGSLALMILEDITELTLLKNLIPICMHCKKIRDDHQYWRQVESYFHQFIGVDFSHGVCPECMQQHYPEASSQKLPRG